MTAPLHPDAVLYQGAGKPFPALNACEHYAGSEKMLRKALQLQTELLVDGTPVFDITGDCEDGAPAGQEEEHARMIAALVMSKDNQHNRFGARIHDISHPAWHNELAALIGIAGSRLAYIVLPKVDRAAEACEQIAALAVLRRQHGIERKIPVHVLIETPAALHEVWHIAAQPEVESIDFGLMDFVSAHRGAIPATAMHSPGQFDHPLVVRAKCEIAAAALANGVVPTHNVTTEVRDMAIVSQDAQRARAAFGFLRMWSIHPAQILPIVEAMRPDFRAVDEATQILVAAQDANWGPIRHADKLHDRASYRYYWELLRRARTTGASIPDDARLRFFN